MRTIIAGTRTLDQYEILEAAIAQSGFAITEVVSGGARGVDALGERWAHEHTVPLQRFVADWARQGKAAGPIRNEAMALYAEALIAVWDGVSRGTADMIRRAQAKGLHVSVYRVRFVLSGELADAWAWRTNSASVDHSQRALARYAARCLHRSSASRASATWTHG